MKNVLKSKLFWITFGIIVVVGLVAFSGGGKAKYETVIADFEEVVEIVSETGTVEADSVINLAFRKSGVLGDLKKEVGDELEKGMVIGSLEQDLDTIDLKRASANLDIAKADLNQIKAGSTNEEKDIAAAQVYEAEVALANSEKRLENIKLANEQSLQRADLQVKNAQDNLNTTSVNTSNTGTTSLTTLELAEKSVDDTYQNAYILISDSIFEAKNTLAEADTILGVDQKNLNDSFESFLSARSSTALNTAKNKFRSLDTKVELLENSMSSISITTFTKEDIDTFLPLAKELTYSAIELTDSTYEVLEKTISSSNYTSTQIATDQASFTTLRAAHVSMIQQIDAASQAIVSAIISLEQTKASSNSSSNTAQGNLTTSENNLEIAKRNLEEVKVQNQISLNNAEMDVEVAKANLQKAKANQASVAAGPRNVDVAAAQARVTQAQISLNEAEIYANYSNLVSPAEGILTELFYDVGESIQQGQEAARVLNTDLTIIANISETDIDKVELEDQVEINFGAFPIDEIFYGEVIAIDPAETVVQGVIYYKVTMTFENPDGRKIRSGMTANIEITTDVREETLALPLEAIKYDGDRTIVEVLQGEEIIEKEIIVGIEGKENIEILSGIKAGEKIVLYELDQS